MGDTRCPACNRFGRKELNGYCKACDQVLFINKINSLCPYGGMILDNALSELKIKSVSEIKFEDRSRFINIIKRRSAVKRRGHIVHEKPILEKYGYAFTSESDKYNIIKGESDIER